mgnify:CR=1 FL=1
MSLSSWYEKEYNPRLTVSDATKYFQRWAEDSVRARASLPYLPDLRYGPGEKETLDLFPAVNSPFLLVFFHGGYWRAFDKSDFSWIAVPLVEAGISVAIVNYALCPSVTLPEIVDQCRRAVAWLYRNIPQYSINAPFVLSGHSAGGHLVAELFSTNWERYRIPYEAFAGGIAISGLFDLEPLLNVSVNTDIRLTKEVARKMSPAYKKPWLRAPLVVAVGALESSEFHRQSKLLVERWPGIARGPIVVPGAHHFNILEALTSPQGPLYRELNC